MDDVHAAQPGVLDRGTGQIVGDAAIGDERALAVGRHERHEARRGPVQGNCVDGHARRAQGGRQPATERIVSDRADDAGRAAQLGEGACRVGRRAAGAEADGGRYIGPLLDSGARGHDDVKHQIADGQQSRPVPAASPNRQADTRGGGRRRLRRGDLHGPPMICPRDAPTEVTR